MKRGLKRERVSSNKKILIISIALIILIIVGALIYNYYIKPRILLSPADSTIQQAFGLPATTACNMFAQSIMTTRIINYRLEVVPKYVTPGTNTPDGTIYCQALASTGISGYVQDNAGTYYFNGVYYKRVSEQANKNVVPNAICTSAGCQPPVTTCTSNANCPPKCSGNSIVFYSCISRTCTNPMQVACPSPTKCTLRGTGAECLTPCTSVGSSAQCPMKCNAAKTAYDNYLCDGQYCIKQGTITCPSGLVCKDITNTANGIPQAVCGI
mgnify:CR=1 FL=1